MLQVSKEVGLEVNIGTTKYEYEYEYEYDPKPVIK
jgi:hypothetical protein